MTQRGKITQIIGSVVDVVFPLEHIPHIYEALIVEKHQIVLEVQQQLGDGYVRTIALGATEGLRRNLLVHNTHKPIQVPVGQETLGRIMDVLGNPIDRAGPIQNSQYASIHRAPPTIKEQATTHTLFET